MYTGKAFVILAATFLPIAFGDGCNPPSYTTTWGTLANQRRALNAVTFACDYLHHIYKPGERDEYCANSPENIKFSYDTAHLAGKTTTANMSHDECSKRLSAHITNCKNGAVDYDDDFEYR